MYGLHGGVICRIHVYMPHQLAIFVEHFEVFNFANLMIWTCPILEAQPTSDVTDISGGFQV